MSFAIVLAALCSAPARAQTASSFAPAATADVSSTPQDSTSSEPAGSPPLTKQVASDQARELGRGGLGAFNEADFATALEAFQRAERLAHSPVFQLYAARCLLALERTAEAHALLATISTETMTASAPEAWRRAQADARVELVLLDPARDPESPSRRLGTFDPDGRVSRVASGVPQMPPWHPEPAPAKNFWQRATASERGSLVAFGVGATGLVFAVVTGALAFVESAKVKENCIGTSCRPEDLPRAQDAEQLANLATVGTTVFAAGATTGVVLWLLPSGPAGGGVSVGLRGPGLHIDARF